VWKSSETIWFVYENCQTRNYLTEAQQGDCKCFLFSDNFDGYAKASSSDNHRKLVSFIDLMAFFLMNLASFAA
jgi:hypothetical protein